MNIQDSEGYTKIELPERLDQRAQILLEHNGKNVIAIDRIIQYHGKTQSLRGELIYDGTDKHIYLIGCSLNGTPTKRGYGIHNIEMLLVED